MSNQVNMQHIQRACLGSGAAVSLSGGVGRTAWFADLQRVFLCLLFCIAPALCAQAATITLLSGAVLEPGSPVMLGDVAAIEDAQEAEKQALSAVVLLSAEAVTGKVWAEIAPADVRAALAQAGVAANRHALSGNVCVARFKGGKAAPAPVEPAQTTPQFTTIPVHNEPAAAGTVRTQVAVVLSSVLGIEPENMRVKFDARDEGMLDVQQFGRRVVVEPPHAVHTGGSSRMILRVRIYDGDQQVETHSLRVDVQVHRAVVRATRRIQRGSALTQSDVEVIRTWVDAGSSTLLGDMSDVLGREARTTLTEGQLVGERDVELPILVRRGEVVDAIALVGGIEVRTKAIAMGNGRRGEFIEFQISRNTEPFFARVDSHGRVILSDGPAS